MLSLRSALNDQGISACPNGLLGLNPFYKSSPDARKCFGFTRLSQIIKALRWPKSFVALGDHPADDNQGWQNGPQGLAHDAVTWFFTREDAFLTIPITTDLQGLSSNHFDKRRSPIPLGNGATYSLASTEPGGADTDIIQIDHMAGFNHLGALTIQSLGDQGRGEESIIYIPVQAGDGGNPNNKPIIYALQSIAGQSITDHNWSAKISQPGDQGAWCAYDPVAKRLYTSDFYGAPGAPKDATIAEWGLFAGTSVDVYSVGTPFVRDEGNPAGQQMVLTFRGSMQLFEADGTPALLLRIQGGFITDNRHLYLVQDDGTGIVGFDLITARKQRTIPVDYKHIQGIWDKTYQEIEAACLFSNPPAPGMSGDIHVLLWENGAIGIGEDFWIKHYGVSDPNDRPFI